MEADEQRVEVGVVAGGPGDLDDAGQGGVGDGAGGAGQPAGLGDLGGGVVDVSDQAVHDGVAVDAAHRGDQVLGGAAPAAGVAPYDDLAPDLLGESFDLQRCGPGDRPVA